MSSSIRPLASLLFRQHQKMKPSPIARLQAFSNRAQSGRNGPFGGSGKGGEIPRTAQRIDEACK